VPDNVRYWFAILWDCISGSFGSIGQTPGALFFAVLSIALGTGLVLVQGGFQAMKAHILQNVLAVLAVAALAWAPFFIWQLARIPYLRFSAMQARATGAESRVETAEKRATVAEGQLKDSTGRIDALNQELAELRPLRRQPVAASPAQPLEHPVINIVQTVVTKIQDQRRLDFILRLQNVSDFQADTVHVEIWHTVNGLRVPNPPPPRDLGFGPRVAFNITWGITFDPPTWQAFQGGRAEVRVFATAEYMDRKKRTTYWFEGGAAPEANGLNILTNEWR